jgi:hypothetical protein
VSGADERRFFVRRAGIDHGPLARQALLDLAGKGELAASDAVTDLKTGESRPAREWALLERALAEHAKKDAEARDAALRVAQERRLARMRRLVLALVAALAAAAVAAVFVLGAQAGPQPDPRVAGLLALYVLVLAGLVAHVERDGSQASESAFHGEPSQAVVRTLGLVALASSAPALALAPYLALEPTAFGEDLEVALVASEMARSGIARGWVAGPLAGFPFGLYEAPLVPALVRALLGLGLSPLGATHLLGTLATLLTPLAAYVAGVRAHLRPGFALAGALVCAWVSASSPHAGGLAGFFGAGLLTSTVAMPLCVLVAGEIAAGTTRWTAPLLAMLVSLVDPGLLFATLLVVGVGATVGARAESPRAPALVATLRTATAAGLVGAAVYGHGLSRLEIPFGPPEALGARLRGAPLEHLVASITSGEMLDAGRAPVLGYLVGAAVLALLAQPTRPAARGVLAATLTAFSWPTLADNLFGHGQSPLSAGALLLLRPADALALVPVACGAALATALEESAPRLEQALDTHARELERVFSVGAGALLAATLALALPGQLAFVMRLRGATLRRAEAPCEATTGHDRSAIATHLRLLDQGRLHWSDGAARCAASDGLALESAVPIGASVGGEARAGTMPLAFRSLEPTRAGSGARAEALGVRHVLELAGTTLPEPWAASEPLGGWMLATHAPRTHLVGAGCVVATWSGSEDALRAEVHAALATPEGADRLLSPTELIALDAGGGDFAEIAVAHADCDPLRTTVTELERESGVLEADVEAATPIDLVFRVSAFPSWAVIVDGLPVRSLRRVAPGFYSVRVEAGRHQVRARASGLPWLWPGFALALVLALLVAFATPKWLEHKTVRLAERPDPWSRRRRL